MVSQQFPSNNFGDPAAVDPAAERQQSMKRGSGKNSTKKNLPSQATTPPVTVSGDEPPPHQIRIVPFAITVIGSIALSAVILTMNDPTARGGISLWIGTVAVPALAVMIAIGILSRQPSPFTIDSSVVWWMFGALPLGTLLACVPMVIQHPDYFEADNIWSVLGFFLMMAFVIFIGYLFGALAWLFILLPLTFSYAAVRDLIQGKPFSVTMAVIPVLLFSAAAMIIVGPMTLSGLPPGSMALGEVLAALFGVRGDYGVAWEGGLWILRGLAILMLVCIVWIIQLGSLRKKAAQAELDNSKTQSAKS